MRLSLSFSDNRNASTMRSFGVLSACLLLVASRVLCESYSKACFINYMLKHELLDKTYQIYNNGEKVDAKCELAVNSTISKMRSTTNDICISNFLRRKYVTETLLKEYLIPQFKGKQTQVHFDDRFTLFKNKALNISSIICNNPKVFKPDLKDMIKTGKSQKEAKAKEIACLQKHTTNRNKPLDEECSKVVNAIKQEFYKSLENEMKKVFAAPNDKLIDLKCSEGKSKKNELFEKISFFFVLSVVRNMNDKQVDGLLKGAEVIITSSTRLIFECMI